MRRKPARQVGSEMRFQTDNTISCCASNLGSVYNFSNIDKKGKGLITKFQLRKGNEMKKLLRRSAESTENSTVQYKK
jgi:hypothetical protein